MNTAVTNNKGNHLIEVLVKKFILLLDETDQTKLTELNNMFSPADCKIIYNNVPYASAVNFLTMWVNKCPQTQHVLQLLDCHIIPGLNHAIVNINCKVKFDETGYTKLNESALIQENHVGGLNRRRPIFGSNFGCSIQLVIDANKFLGQKDQNGVVMSFNYNIVYKPLDSLMQI